MQMMLHKPVNQEKKKSSLDTLRMIFLWSEKHE